MDTDSEAQSFNSSHCASIVMKTELLYHAPSFSYFHMDSRFAEWTLSCLLVGVCWGQACSLLSLSGLTDLETQPVEVTCYYQKQWFPNLVFKEIFRQNSSVTKQIKGKLLLARYGGPFQGPAA